MATGPAGSPGISTSMFTVRRDFAGSVFVSVAGSAVFSKERELDLVLDRKRIRHENERVEAVARRTFREKP